MFIKIIAEGSGTPQSVLNKKFCEIITDYMKTGQSPYVDGKKFIINTQAREIVLQELEHFHSHIVASHWPELLQNPDCANENDLVFKANNRANKFVIGGSIYIEQETPAGLAMQLFSSPSNEDIPADHNLAKKIILEILQKAGLNKLFHISIDVLGF